MTKKSSDDENEWEGTINTLRNSIKEHTGLLRVDLNKKIEMLEDRIEVNHQKLLNQDNETQKYIAELSSQNKEVQST